MLKERGEKNSIGLRTLLSNSSVPSLTSYSALKRRAGVRCPKVRTCMILLWQRALLRTDCVGCLTACMYEDSVGAVPANSTRSVGPEFSSTVVRSDTFVGRQHIVHCTRRSLFFHTINDTLVHRSLKHFRNKISNKGGNLC